MPDADTVGLGFTGGNGVLVVAGQTATATRPKEHALYDPTGRSDRSVGHGHLSGSSD